jgi:hypothetical protein
VIEIEAKGPALAGDAQRSSCGSAAHRDHDPQVVFLVSPMARLIGPVEGIVTDARRVVNVSAISAVTLHGEASHQVMSSDVRDLSNPDLSTVFASVESEFYRSRRSGSHACADCPTSRSRGGARPDRPTI